VSSTVADTNATARVTHFSTYGVMGDLNTTAVSRVGASRTAAATTARTAALYTVTGQRLQSTGSHATRIAIRASGAVGATEAHAVVVGK
jgi:hypothetical protein